jgi:hypothetical protein
MHHGTHEHPRSLSAAPTRWNPTAVLLVLHVASV